MIVMVDDRIDFGDDDVLLLLLLSRQPILRMAKINLSLYPHSLSVVIVIVIQFVIFFIRIVIDNNIITVNKMRIKQRR